MHNLEYEAITNPVPPPPKKTASDERRSNMTLV